MRLLMSVIHCDVMMPLAKTKTPAVMTSICLWCWPSTLSDCQVPASPPDFTGCVAL